MNTIPFYKYQGTGNDFVMIDNRENLIDRNDLPLVSKLCNRRFGIGADGLILIEKARYMDFEMVYFNSDGSQSMCGNGARCAVKFSADLGIISDTATFLAIDGEHSAYIKNELVHLKMGKTGSLESREEDVFIDTGSPHHIRWVKDLDNYDVYGEGKKIRYSDLYGNAGTNVNFVEAKEVVKVRTYERGVEDETFSCGTGVTAVALALSEKGYHSPVKMITKGGELQVSFRKENGSFSDIYLIGPAKQVFQGEVHPEFL